MLGKSNFHVINIDGNNFDEIAAAFKEAREVKRVREIFITLAEKFCLQTQHTTLRC